MTLSLEQIRAKAIEEALKAGGNVDRNYIERELLHLDLLNSFINSKSLDEIMADKIVSFAMSDYTRWRDLWDMNWISNNPEYQGNEDAFLPLKLQDYSIADIANPIQVKLKLIPDLIGSKEFYEQANRFFPASISKECLQKPSFQQSMKKTLSAVYEKALETVSQKVTAKDRLTVYAKQKKEHSSPSPEKEATSHDER